MSWDQTDPTHCPCCDTHGACVHQGPTRPAHVAWRLGSRAAEDHLWGTCQRGVPTPAELGHEPPQNPYAEDSDEHGWWARAWSATYARIQWQAARIKASCSHPQAQAGVCVDCGADLDTPPAPRRPVAGWVDKGTSGLRLTAGGVTATVHRMRDHSQVFLTPTSGAGRIGVAIVVESVDVDTVRLAAEDALRAVLVDAAAALGLLVVPS